MWLRDRIDGFLLKKRLAISRGTATHGGSQLEVPVESQLTNKKKCTRTLVTGITVGKPKVEKKILA